MFTEFKIDHKVQTNSYEPNLFILISLLHINGFINRDSLKAQFKSLKAGTLNRRVGTYHSRVNNQWYNDENVLDVYEDIFESMMYPKDPKIRLRLERMNKMRKINGLPLKKYTKTLSFEEVIKYLNLYLGRNRNYCIHHLYFEYIKPSILKAEYNFGPLNDMFNYDFSNLERYVSYYDGSYCCEDCDGPYERFLEYHDSEKNKAIRKELARLVSEFLNKKRTKFKGSYKEYTI